MNGIPVRSTSSDLGTGAQSYYMPAFGKLFRRTVSRDARIFETGCGRGHFLAWLGSHDYTDVVGCDLGNHLDVAHLGFEFRRVDLSNEPIPCDDQCVDAVVSLHVIEHLENPWAYVRELRRILRPGGHLFIAYPSSKDFVSRIKFLLRADVPSYSRTNNHYSFFTQSVEDKLFANFELQGRIYASRSIPLVGRGRLPGRAVWSHKSLAHYLLRPGSPGLP